VPARRGTAFEFSFQDVVLLRSAQGLLDAGVPARRVRKALADVTKRLGSRPPSSLRFHAVGRRIIIDDGATTWNPETGQLLFSFRPADLKRATAAPAALPRAKSAAVTAPVDWFERAVDLEEAGDPVAARDAYRKVLQADPAHSDACVNLGRLLQQAGNLGEAAALYRRAIATDARDAVAHYNLALVLEDQQRPTQAIEHYQKAVRIAPDFADAHYNLARLFEQRGRHADAVRHLIMYSKLNDG